MAERYYVNRNPRRRRSSALPLIFEKIIWGFFILVAVVLVLSVLWRKAPHDTPQDAARVSSKIIRQIPRAQLEFAGKKLVTGESGNALSVAVESSAKGSVPGTGGAEALDASRQSRNTGQPANAETPAATTAQTGKGATQQAPQRSANVSGTPPAKPGAAQKLTESGGNAVARVPGASAVATKRETSTPASQTAATNQGERKKRDTIKHAAVAGQSPAGRYLVRVGAFKRQANVADIRSHIEALGYATRTWEFNHKKLGHLYMLDLVPFKNREAAVKAKQEVESRERLRAQVIEKSP